MTTLGVLVQRLSPSVLTTSEPLTDEAAAREVNEIVLYDEATVADVTSHDVVLGVGLRRPDDAVSTLRKLSRAAPAALVVRADLAAAPAVVEAARTSLTWLLAVDAAANWMQVTLLLRELLGSDGGDAPELLSDDLFRVANAIEALVDAPVTIEDPHSRILAFSEGQERADEARHATILGRKAPEEYHSRMKQHGVFRRLHTAEEPIFVPGRPPKVKPRVVQPVRASGEFLGSIWLVVDEPLDADKERALSVAARTVALHLLRQRLAADAWRGAEVATASALLEGGSVGEDAARRIGLSAPAYVVAALSSRGEAALDNEAMLLRLWDGLRIGLSTIYRSAVAAKIDDTIFAVIPLPTAKTVGGSDPDVRKFIVKFLDNHAPRHAGDIIVGLGASVASIGDLPRSRDQAARVLRVLRNSPRKRAIADIAEVGAQALVQHVIDSLDVDPSLGAAPLRRLEEYDQAKNAQFAATVAAWLDSFGDTDVAAEMLHVHPNTVRYRIRQLRELKLVNLDDPTTRLALLLHLHRRRVRGSA